MTSHLTYRPREGMLFGVVAGRSIRAATLRSAAAMNAGTWHAAVPPGGTAAARVTSWEKAQEVPSGVPVGAVGHKLTVAANAALEVFDYPGEFAQRFDGVDKGGGSSDHRQHARVVWIKSALRQGFPVHGPPACGHPRCIVVAHDWDPLFHALRGARQVSLVVEI